LDQEGIGGIGFADDLWRDEKITHWTLWKSLSLSAKL